MRPRLTSLYLSCAGGVKPRLGRRRWRGIWPPSKPLMRTPERAVWPLPPRPACLPWPDPMPRPTRMRGFDDPGLSLTSLSFMAASLLAVDDAHEMRDLGDHSAIGGRVSDARLSPDLIEPKALQRIALRYGTANVACGLLKRNGFVGAHDSVSTHESGASASTPWRRDWVVDTLRLRLWATERGLSSRASASKVARTMLYGFDEPWLLATTSCTPSDSKTARMGPPAMMPVPAGAARRPPPPAPWRPFTS